MTRVKRKTGAPKTAALAGRDAVTHVAVVPGAERVVVAHANGTIRVWDAATAQVACEVHAHGSTVECVAILPGGELAVSGAKDATFAAWSITTGNIVRRDDGEADDVIEHIFPWSDASRVIVRGYTDTWLHIWSLATGETIDLEREVEMTTGFLESVAVRGHEVIAADGHVVATWDARNPAAPTTSHPLGEYGDCTVSPDGRLAYKTPQEYEDPEAGTLGVWDVATGKRVRRIAVSDQSFTAAFDPSFAHFVHSAKHDKLSCLKLWSLADERCIATLEGGHPNIVIEHRVFSPDGKLLATSSQDANKRADDRRPPWERTGVVCLWDLVKHEQRARWELPAIVKALAITPAGRVVAGLHDGTVKFLS